MDGIEDYVLFIADLCGQFISYTSQCNCVFHSALQILKWTVCQLQNAEAIRSHTCLLVCASQRCFVCHQVLETHPSTRPSGHTHTHAHT